MKKALEQAGGLLPADAQASEVLKPTEGAFHRPPPLVTAKRPTVLSDGAIGSIGCDHLNVLSRERGIERVTVVSFVTDDARRRLAGDHEVEQSLHQPALVRPCLGGVGRHGQTLGVNQQHDLYALSHSGDANTITTLACLAERGVNEALVEFEAAAPLNASARLAHDALENSGLRPPVKPVMHCALRPELRRQVLPLGAIVQDPEDTLHHLALVRWWPPSFPAAQSIRNLITYPIKLCISKLKHVLHQQYTCLPILEVFG